ncbi:hypothetical protein I5Q27_07240 [Serratia marcescens]|nr:hypothetical protein [Serratia marcescens]
MKLSDGISVLALTSLAYLCTYAYEIGFCLHYGIPRGLIQISVTNMLFFGFTLIALFCSIIKPIEDYLNFKGRSTRKDDGAYKIIKQLSIKYLIFIPIGTLSLLLYPFRWQSFALQSVILAGFLLKDFIAPLFHTHLDTYKEKLEYEKENNTNKGIASFIENEGIKNTFVIFMFSIILMVISSLIGGLNAKYSSESITCNEKYRILTIYGDNAIVSEMGEKGKKFKVIPVTECTFETNKK